MVTIEGQLGGAMTSRDHLTHYSTWVFGLCWVVAINMARVLMLVPTSLVSKVFSILCLYPCQVVVVLI